MKSKALFLFNHDAGHQVAHLAGIAAATARLHPDIEAIVAYATPAIRTRLSELITPEDAQLLTWIELTLPKWARATAKQLDRIIPASRLMRLRLNKALFASVDVVISTERTCLRLKRYLRPEQTPLFAIVPHGAGDRSVSFHPDFQRFDCCLVAGRKVVDQFVAHGVEPDRLVIVGYPKFEDIDISARHNFFDNGRPTFVYNPHFDPHLSSWYDAGPELLEWFASEAGRDYNLIFAPHVMLFRKALHISPEYKVSRRRPDIPDAAKNAPNILIDVDSERLFDMSYMLSADAYIGDVSSQIYEFLSRPRPAFFLDMRKQRDEADDHWHLFWKAGPLLHNVPTLASLIPDYAAIGQEYRAKQDEIFRYTFSITDDPPSARAANAIARLIQKTGTA